MWLVSDKLVAALVDFFFFQRRRYQDSNHGFAAFAASSRVLRRDGKLSLAVHRIDSIALEVETRLLDGKLSPDGTFS